MTRTADDATKLPEQFARGFALHQQGSLAEAEKIYEEILRQHPTYFDALHMLGVVALQTNRAASSVELIKKAVAVNPDMAIAHGNLGIGLQSLNRHNEALASYGTAIALKPDYAEAHHNRGTALHQLERHQEALTSYDKAIALTPDYMEAHYNRGIALHKLEHYQKAVASYDKAIALKPDYAEAHHNRGVALHQLERHQEAVASYDKAIALKPDYAEAYSSSGNALHRIERHQEALARYDKAIALKPNYAEAYYNRGVVLRHLKRHEEALANCDKAIALKPDYAEAHHNRGSTLHYLKRYEESLASCDKAIALKPDYAEAYGDRGVALHYFGRHEEILASCDKAIALKPDYAGAHHGRGAALHYLQRYEEALANFDAAIALKPDYAEARHNRSLTLLTLGKFEQGWQQYEWRKRLDDPVGNRVFEQPAWLGKETIEGRHLFLHWEQGLGDTIQFCRYAKLVQAMGVKVTLSVQTPLRRLIAQISPDMEVIGGDETPPAFDYHCPLMSLPLAMGTTLETIPSEPRYLAADARLRAEWATRLPPKRKPRIGLMWRGRPDNKSDHNRSMDLAALLPLFGDSAEWIWLQKELSDEEAALLRQNKQAAFIGNDPKDFNDAAALIELMDLVITVDTSMVHLAGALGKPVWLLQCYNAEWRWLLNRTDSPWYPSARLFRQHEAGNWSGVIDMVRNELRGLIGNGALSADE